MAEQKKRKQKPKRGRVIRVQPEIDALLRQEQQPGESLSDCLRRMIDLPAEVRYVLPSDLHESASKARGVATIRAYHAKTKQAERPVPVRVGR